MRESPTNWKETYFESVPIFIFWFGFYIITKFMLTLNIALTRSIALCTMRKYDL